VKQLVVNADDLGLTQGVTRGIVEAHQAGIVTSTSMLVTGPGFEAAAELLASVPGLGVGLHLDLTVGHALSGASALTDADGAFCHTPAGIALGLWRSTIDPALVREEWGRQLTRFQTLGRRPTHVDSEKHVHMLPALFPIALEIASRAGAPAIRITADSEVCSRMRPLTRSWRGAAMLSALAYGARRRARARGLTSADACLGIIAGSRLDRAEILRLLARLREGTTELVCHPAYEGPELLAFHSLHYPPGDRVVQLNALTHPDVLASVRRAGIRLSRHGV